MPEWRTVPSYEGLYEVSDAGGVRSVPRQCVARRKTGAFTWIVPGGPLKPYVDRYGYATLLLSKDGTARRFKVHRLVCETFHGPQPEGCEVAHMNDDKQDNSASNLKWVTRRENMAHRTQPIEARA
jgi:hypothetical protein